MSGSTLTSNATTTQTITSANSPLTIASGVTLSVFSLLDLNQSGEAVYTGDSPVNATTLGGPTLVNNGVILDTSPVESANEYAIQSVGAADFTLVNHGLVSASNFIAVGMNDGKILVATKHGRINGRSGVPDVLGAAINRRVHRDALHVSIVGWSIGELSVIWLDVDMLPTCWSPPLRVVFTATAGTPV